MGGFEDFFGSGLDGKGWSIFGGGSEFLQISILNYTSRLLFDLLFNIYVQTERCCTTCYFSINSLLFFLIL